jgi:plastocyanin
MKTKSPCRSTLRVLAWTLSAIAIGRQAGASMPPAYNRTVVADVVALDQPFLYNRLGTSQPGGMVFALKLDVVSRDAGSELKPGRVMLRQGKRPRPLVLRANSGDRLLVRFTNLLTPAPTNGSATTRYVGFQVNGLDLGDAKGVVGDGTWVGKNPSGLAAPGETKEYEYFARAEGTFLLCNGADTAEGGQSAGLGLFGAVNVQPEWAEWYRSQVTREDLIDSTMPAPAMGAATRAVEVELITPRSMTLIRKPPVTGQVRQRSVVRGEERELFTLRTTVAGKRAESLTDVVVIDGRLYTTLDQPLINYNARYGAGPRRGQPVLKMLEPRRESLLFSTDPASFPAEKVREAIEGFNNVAPFVSPDLRQIFQDRGKELSDRVRVSEDEGRAWILTDPGRGVYLVEAVPQAGAPNQLRVSSASLHIIHSDLTAIITGPKADRFSTDINSPSFFTNPTYPDRRQPYREFTILYHQAPQATQAFSSYYNKNMSFTLGAGSDGFAINYGVAGIGSEILASRLGVGPMGNPDAVDLKYEEFFLSSWAVGDPAMVVDVPANSRNQAVTNPDQKSQAPQEPLFQLEEVEADDAIVANLNKGIIPQKLLDEFKAHGVTVSPQSFSSTVAANTQWVVLDPFDPNGKPTADRARYPIIRLGDTQTHTGIITRLGAFKGFPTSPNLPAYNAMEGLRTPGQTPVVATKAYFPDDPSNVYHSNIRDHVKFRILHAGPGPSHVHHLHAHQWLHSPNSAQAQYLDSQLIIPGSTYTLEMVYGGSGNRNLTVGDSIFHCHFYPHFAQGMWSLWRSHDVLETGTWLDDDGRPVTHVTTIESKEVPVYLTKKDGETRYFYHDKSKQPKEVPAGEVHRAWNRALPDGEIDAGSPIPAIVPVPSIAMPLKPARVRLTDLKPFLSGEDDGQGRRVEVEMKNKAQVDAGRAQPDYDNPGYPFFIPGLAGHRAPHPPLDFAWREDAAGKPMLDGNNKKIALNGGLPRHVVLGGKTVTEYHTRWDFTREFLEYDADGNPVDGQLNALELPEEGTPYEQAAMRHHSQRAHASYLPNGDPGNITRNGLKGKPGAPYAPPEVDDQGNGEFNARRYQAAVIQTDVVLNKQGWHFPQQRFLSLWEDVGHTIGGTRPTQPLVFRSATGDTIEFWHTNLVPAYYELDDFQVRTPTDVIGQHIHNVKFDVTSSDGGGNGFNYEDGTFSPDEVRTRINAVNRTPDPFGGGNGLLQFDTRTSFINTKTPPKELKIVKVKDAYPRRGDAGDDEHGLFGRPPLGQNWDGAQTTVQRWDSDPLLDIYGEERTLRTIFTHDHFGPSTHQQTGLYAGLVVEPEGSLWYLPSGERMYQRRDGGPTSWDGYVVTADADKSYREFAIEFQDTQLAYGNASRSVVSSADLDPARSKAPSALFDVAQYPGMGPNQISVFMKQLDKQVLPPVFVSQIFPAMGISLTGREAVTKLPGGAGWTIQVPKDSAVNAGATYTLQTKNQDNSLVVYTPQIPPGWADPLNALNPQTDSNNSVTGPPYPKIISAGLSGTYSMNYRNEPAISRLSTTDPATTKKATTAASAPHPQSAPVAASGEHESVPAPGPGGLRSVPPSPAAATAVIAAAPADDTIEIDGDLLASGPTWVFKGNKALNVPVVPGKTIVWKATKGTHGVVFNTEAQGRSILDFETGGALPPLGPQTVRGEAVWGTAPQPAGTVLARAKVKAGGVLLTFFCSQHGPTMNGSLMNCSPPADEATDPAFLFKSITRKNKALNVQPVPGTLIDPATATREISGEIAGGHPTWLSDGQLAAKVPAKPGDLVVWKATSGTHGVVFNTEAAAKAVLDFETGGGLPPLGPQTVRGEAVWGTAPHPAGTVLARAKVKADAPMGTTLDFFCSQHGRAMSGSLAANWFTFPAYVVNPSTAADKGGVEQTDPFTPLMRAYAGDDVQVRVLVGAHTLAHSAQIQGVKWPFEPEYPDSGWKNSQAMGISEHFEFIFKLPPVGAGHEGGNLLSFADYLISPSSSVDGLANGTWSMIRAFTEPVGTKKPGEKPSPTYLAPLPSNPHERVLDRKAKMAKRLAEVAAGFEKKKSMTGSPPPELARFQSFDVTATTAFKALGGNPLSFNPLVSPSEYDLKDAVMFVRTGDLQGGVLKPDAPREPLILRVAAGSWIEINLTNDLGDDPAALGFPCPQDLSFGTPFQNNPNVPSTTNVLFAASRQVGLHPALVSFDVTTSNGVNVGFNPDSTVAPGSAPNTRTFYWYAGELSFINDELQETPIEYGAINLVPGDLMVHPQFGMVGALVVEPAGSRTIEDKGTYASATVMLRDRSTFRDFVLVGQNLVANATDGAGNQWGAFNYRTETFNARTVDPAASGSQLTAINALSFATDNLPPLGPVNVKVPPNAPPGFRAETAFGTNPQTPAPAGTVLASTTVKEGTAAGTNLGFFCSRHGRAMSGSLAVQAGGGAPATVEIDGVILNGKPTWVVGNSPAENVPVKPGDTVIWKAVSGTHGIVSDTQAQAEAVLAFQTGNGLPALGPQTVGSQQVWGTAPQAPALGGTIIARATVNTDVAAGSKLGFFCSQHGRPMSGSLSFQAAGGPAATVEIDGVILNGTPTWVVDTNKPANDVPVKPGDTVIWKAVSGAHGVLFDSSFPGLGYGLALSNKQNVPSSDPQTPLFRAAAGNPVRFRLVMPSTSTVHAGPTVFDIHGHGWPEEPFASEGTVIGGWPVFPFVVGVRRPPMNYRSQYLGAQTVAVYEAFNFVIDRAGGRFGIPRDYLYEGFQTAGNSGMWGIFRVEKDFVAVNEVTVEGSRLTLRGIHQPSAENRGKPVSITVTRSSRDAQQPATLDGSHWSLTTDYRADRDETFSVKTSLGGSTGLKVPAGLTPTLARMQPAPTVRTER